MNVQVGDVFKCYKCRKDMQLFRQNIQMLLLTNIIPVLLGGLTISVVIENKVLATVIGLIMAFPFLIMFLSLLFTNPCYSRPLSKVPKKTHAKLH